jgi:outer membrane protein assembly factor BamB
VFAPNNGADTDSTKLSKMKKVSISALVCLLLVPTLNAQESWTRFRGANGEGVAAAANIPGEITDDNYFWKVKLAGVGSSSPVIFGDRLFITSCDSKTATINVQCLELKSGKELWKKSFANQAHRIHKWNSYASSTPAVDANHVYVTYANPEQTMLVALDHEGDVKWERDFGTWQSSHGFSASPIVHDGKVFFFNSQQGERLRPGQTPGKSRLTAVNSSDGTDIWETSLTTTRTCYAVPAVYTDENGGQHIVSCNTGDGFFSLNPENGTKDWATLPFKMRTVAATLIVDGMIIGSNGSGGGGNYLVAIRPGKSATEKPEMAYQIKSANYVPTPIAVDGKLILFTDKGLARCVDLKTGEPQWVERMSSAFSGSPVATKKHVYIVDPDGTLFTLKVGDKFELVSKHSLGEPSRATPAIVNDRIYLRTDSHLICAGSKTAEQSIQTK